MKQRRRAPVILTAIVSLMLATTALAKPKTKAPQGSDAVEGVVNINSASADQLQLLPRIGRTTAERIIAYRAKRKFRGTYDVVRVKGIGRKTYHRLKPYLTVKGPTTLTRKVRSKSK